MLVSPDEASPNALVDNLRIIDFFCGFSWRLASNKLVIYRHQLVWSGDPDIYSF